MMFLFENITPNFLNRKKFGTVKNLQKPKEKKIQ